MVKVTHIILTLKQSTIIGNIAFEPYRRNRIGRVDLNKATISPTATIPPIPVFGLDLNFDELEDQKWLDLLPMPPGMPKPGYRCYRRCTQISFV